MSKIRPRLIVASAAGTGLVAGLALGVTGLAHAATPSSPATSASASAADATQHGRHHGKQRGAGDLITAVNGNKVTLDTPLGVRNATVTSATVYKRGQSTATLADVKPNEIVGVRFVDPTASAVVIKSIQIELAHADGYVTAVNGTSFTVIGRDGFARTIQESPTTVYRNGGAAGGPSEVTVGKLVRAEGNVDANGTTLDATRIGTGTPPRPQPDAGPDAPATTTG